MTTEVSAKMNGADSYLWTEDPLPVQAERALMFYIGVDPGVSGGLAIINDTGEIVRAARMPETDRDVFDWFKTWAVSGITRAVLERAGASPQMGVTSAFTFGKQYGLVRMALIAAGIPFDVITPQTWQKFMSCRSGGDKNVTKARAQQLFPTTKVTHAIADALLLAEFCRRVGHGSTIPFTERHSDQRSRDGGNDGKGKVEEGLGRELARQVKEAEPQGRRARAAHRADPKARPATAAARR